MNILLKYHIRKEDEKYSLDEKCWTIYPPRSRQVRFTLKSPVRLTPLPKLPSPTYPQIVCTIYPQIVFGDLPPLKLPSPTYPQIVFGDLLPFKCEVFEYIVLNIKNS